MVIVLYCIHSLVFEIVETSVYCFFLKTCRFLLIFFVVSKKKCTFGGNKYKM